MRKSRFCRLLLVIGLQVVAASWAAAQEVMLCGNTGTEPAGPMPGGQSGVLGDVRILVLLCNFPTDGDPSPPPATVRGYGFTGPEFTINGPGDAYPLIFDDRYPQETWSNQTINDWFREASFDQMRISGQVAGYFTLPIDVYPRPTNWNTYLNEVKQEAIAIASAPPPQGGGLNVGLDTNGELTGEYDRVVFAIPLMQPFVLGRGGGSFAWVLNISPHLFIHELGHTFGLHHAASLDCPLSIVGDWIQCPPGPCRWEEYGDPYDPMDGDTGGQALSHFNAYRKNRLGWWMQSNQFQTVTSPGTFVLTPLETAAGLKGLSISGGNGESLRTFHLDFRRRIGYWPAIAPANIDGALLYDFGPCPFDLCYTSLLDTTPSPQIPDFYDAALRPGSEFLYAPGGLRVRAVSLSGTGENAQLSVDVQLSSMTDVDAGPDVVLPWGGSTALEASIVGGTPPYHCQWTPSCGLDDPSSCAVVVTQDISYDWFEPLYTVIVTDSSSDPVPRGDQVRVAFQYEDCNEDQYPDPLDILYGYSGDCNSNAVPDECEEDCNGNRLLDECDVAAGTSQDADGNGFPDECAVLRVNHTTPFDGYGLSWGTAFSSLQDAFEHARRNPGAVREIWVAEGTYSPDNFTGLRTASFNSTGSVGVID